MSKMHAFRWSLALVALLVPAMVEAQAGTASASKGSELRQTPTTGVVPGLLAAIAADTGQVSATADTGSRAKPARQSGKSKKPHRDVAADSVKTREEGERDQYHSPY